MTEVSLPTLRTNTVKLPRENEAQLSRNLDLIKETRDMAAIEIKRYQKMAHQLHDRKVRLRKFQEGDWVLKRIVRY